MTADEPTTVSPDGDPPVKIDTTVAHQARIYNYLLGGKDNFAVDREAADRAIEAFPGLAVWARNNRAFLGRAVRYLVAEAGVHQFLDIGTGLPTANNTHEVAQRIEPTARVCYVDNDPIVLTHARALLTSHPAGVTDYVHASFQNPDRILGEAARMLDFSQPIAVMLLAILHVIAASDDPSKDPYQIVSRVMDAMPAGSFLVISHPASDIYPEQAAEIARRFNQRLGSVQSAGRSQEEVARFFTGLDLVPPGLVTTPQWRPEPGSLPADPDPAYAGVARKP
jgi:S-adenosyl methyltransferase